MQAIKANLLVVDDDDAIRALLAERLSIMGHKVRSAADGFSALLELRQEVPEIILSDLDMPQMSGFEFLSVVRRRFPEIRVIAMSGDLGGDEKTAGVAADAFYEKGASFGKLLLTIEALSDPDLLVLEGNREEHTPVWVEGNGYRTSAAPTMMSCSECFRSFPEVLKAEPKLIVETRCPHCQSTIRYAIAPERTSA